MRGSRSSYRDVFCYVIVALLMAAISGPPACAQEADESRQLERVEVLPPERRPAPAPARRAERAAESDQISRSDSPEPRYDEVPSSPETTLSPSTRDLVEAKSGISIGADALPAQVQIITPEDIQQLNIRGADMSDLFRRIPAVKPVNFGQGQLSTAIMMRGFRSSGQVGLFVDGVPQNFPAWNNGFEISWLAPEVIERIEIIKGPFSALYGDFAMAGVINITTKKSAPSPSVRSFGGSFGAFRAFGMLSDETWVPTPLLAYEYYRTDGYRENSQLRQWSPFNKASIPLYGGILSLRYNYFDSVYGAPGYLPIDWVKSGQMDRLRAINTSDGGDRQRFELVMNYAPACGERGLYGTLYTGDSHHIRYATFLPVTSSQFARQEDRMFWGGRLYYNMVFRDVASLTVGGETRYDNGEVQQYSTVLRQRTTTRYDYEFSQTNCAIFLQAQIKPVEQVKIVGGVRWDFFTQDISNLVLPEYSGKGFPYIRSPKIGFVFTPTKNFNIFGNIGCGFRSPNVTELSPYRTSGTPNFSLDPAMVQTYDIGCNASVFGNLYLAADYYHTNMMREIRIINLHPQIVGNTVREGYELEAKYFPSENINFFASYGWVDTEVTDPTTPGQNLVVEISEHSIKGGVTMQKDFGPYGQVLADLYYEYFSGGPYYPSRGTAEELATPIYGPDFDAYNFKLNYSGRGWSAFVSGRCVPREYSSDYTWVSDNLLAFDPKPKWDVLSGLTYTFW